METALGQLIEKLGVTGGAVAVIGYLVHKGFADVVRALDKLGAQVEKIDTNVDELRDDVRDHELASARGASRRAPTSPAMGGA